MKDTTPQTLGKRKAVHDDEPKARARSNTAKRLSEHASAENIIALLEDFGAPAKVATKPQLAARLAKLLHEEAPATTDSDEDADDTKFYEGIFMDFTGGDFDDLKNTVAYWTDGLSIIRERVEGKWVYRCEEY